MVFGRHDVKISLWRNKNVVAKLKKKKKENRNALTCLVKGEGFCLELNELTVLTDNFLVSFRLRLCCVSPLIQTLSNEQIYF